MIIDKENLNEFIQRSGTHIKLKYEQITQLLFTGKIGGMFNRLPLSARQLLYKIFEAGFVEGVNYAKDELEPKNKKNKVIDNDYQL